MRNDEHKQQSDHSPMVDLSGKQNGKARISPMPEPQNVVPRQSHSKIGLAGFVVALAGCLWIAFSLLLFESRGPMLPYLMVAAGFFLGVVALIRGKGTLTYAKWAMAIGPLMGVVYGLIVVALIVAWLVIGDH